MRLIFTTATVLLLPLAAGCGSPDLRVDLRRAGNSAAATEITARQAIDVALERHSGNVASIERGQADAGSPSYGVVLFSEGRPLVVVVDANRGTAISSEPLEIDGGRFRALPSALARAPLSLSEIIGIALTRVAGSVLEAEFEIEDGALIGEVEIVNAEGLYEVEVDAETGAVLEVEEEDEDDEDDDDEDR